METTFPLRRVGHALHSLTSIRLAIQQKTLIEGRILWKGVRTKFEVDLKLVWNLLNMSRLTFVEFQPFLNWQNWGFTWGCATKVTPPIRNLLSNPTENWLYKKGKHSAPPPLSTQTSSSAHPTPPKRRLEWFLWTSNFVERIWVKFVCWFQICASFNTTNNQFPNFLALKWNVESWWWSKRDQIRAHGPALPHCHSREQSALYLEKLFRIDPHEFK